MPKGFQGFQKGHKPFQGIEKTQFKKGQIPWIKGKKGFKGYWAGKKRPDISSKRKGHLVSEETREKIRKKLQGRKLPLRHPFTIKGKIPAYTFPKGHIPWNKNKKGEYKLPGVSKYQRGKKHPEYSGKNHWNWKNGKTSENRKIRKSLDFKEWREKVFERDNYTCWICEEKGGYLHPHHLKKFNDYPKLRFKDNNGLTLCKFCHKTYTNYGNNN